MIGKNDRADEIRQAVADVNIWICSDNNSNISRAVEVVLNRLEELESALNWETSCTSCATVLDSSVKETEAKERAVRLVEEYRKEAQDVRAWNDLLKKALLRSNEKYRKAHRRALEAEKKLVAMQLIPVYVTDHTFDGYEGKLCLTELFGTKCGLGEEFHHLKPSRCPEPVACGCDCSCLDQENLGHTCSLHADQEKPALTEWEDHVTKYGTVPGDHQYLSTACLHLDHDKCRLTCKWCPSACLCDCHDESIEVRASVVDSIEEQAAFYRTALKNRPPSEAQHCPEDTGSTCMYEAQGYRRCQGVCEVSPKF